MFYRQTKSLQSFTATYPINYSVSELEARVVGWSVVLENLMMLARKDVQMTV